MKKTLVRCWPVKEKCHCGETVEIFFTVPDFGDCNKLFPRLGCGEVFSVNPETEFYSHTPFEKLREKLSCPVCGTSLEKTVPFPDNYICKHCKTVDSFVRMGNEIPPDNKSTVKECWNPYE